VGVDPSVGVTATLVWPSLAAGDVDGVDKVTPGLGVDVPALLGVVKVISGFSLASVAVDGNGVDDKVTPGFGVGVSAALGVEMLVEVSDKVTPGLAVGVAAPLGVVEIPSVW